MAQDESKQTTKVEDKEWRTTFSVFEENHVPSWKVYANPGTAHFDAMLHKNAGWLSLTMIEGYDKSGRQTMMTLTPETARALRDFLNANVK